MASVLPGSSSLAVTRMGSTDNAWKDSAWDVLPGLSVLSVLSRTLSVLSFVSFFPFFNICFSFNQRIRAQVQQPVLASRSLACRDLHATWTAWTWCRFNLFQMPFQLSEYLSCRKAVTQRNSNATLIVAFLYRLAEAREVPKACQWYEVNGAWPCRRTYDDV